MSNYRKFCSVGYVQKYTRKVCPVLIPVSGACGSYVRALNSTPAGYGNVLLKRPGCGYGCGYGVNFRRGLPSLLPVL